MNNKSILKSIAGGCALLSFVTLPFSAFSTPVLAKSQAKNKPVTKQVSPKKSASWVVLKAAVDKPLYTPRQAIQVRLTATNTSKHSAFLRFNSGQRFDFSIYNVANNQSVYTWSATKMFAQVIGSLWLKPGQSQEFDATVGEEMGTLPAGKYRLIARLANSPRSIAAAPIYFEVSDLGLSIAAKTNKSSYKVGEEVQIDVSVANRLARENHVRFDSGLDCDVFISNEAGQPIWNYGANIRFIRALGEVGWQKGETKNYMRTWNGTPQPFGDQAPQLAPGRYRVQVVIQSTPQLFAPPVFIEITP